MRMKTDDRKEQLLGVAVGLAETHGYQRVTREMIAAQAKCSTGLINQRFGTMTQLRRAIMRHAIHNKILKIVGQGLAANDPHAKKVPEEMKRKALAALA